MYNLNNFKTFELSNMHSFEIEIIVIAVSDFVAGGDEERGSAEGARGEAATLCLQGESKKTGISKFSNCYNSLIF